MDAWAARHATKAVVTIDAYKKRLAKAAQRAAAAAGQLAAQVATQVAAENGAAPAAVNLGQAAAAPAPGAPEMAAAAVVEHPLGDGEAEDDILEEEELDVGLVLILG